MRANNDACHANTAIMHIRFIANKDHLHCGVEAVTCANKTPEAVVLQRYIAKWGVEWKEACCERGARHTSPAIAELVDGNASHEQNQCLPLPYGEVTL